MKRQYVRDLVEGAHVDAPYAVRSRDLRSARTGDAYLSLEIGDRTGTISAVRFRPSPSDEAVPAGTVVHVRGTVTSFRGVRRVSVESMRPVSDYERSDMIPSGVRDRAELVEELRALVRGVRHAGLRALLESLYSDPDFMRRFVTCPGARGRHHAYVGGLLEHSVAVATLCRHLAAAYPTADPDLLVTAALLHDIGKMDEIEFDVSLGYSDSGRMMGHVVAGERVVGRAAAKLGDAIEGDLALRLSHALLAHHGELEWGSPVKPCTIEALLLHQADHLDATAAAFGEAVAGAALLEESWTDGSNGFGRALRVPLPAVSARAV